MANQTVYPVTTSGDEVNPVDLWHVATAATVRVLDTFTKKRFAMPVTNIGNEVNPAEFWLVAAPADLHLSVPVRNIRAQPDVFDSLSGYVFPINPATLQPQLPRSTQFPYAP